MIPKTLSATKQNLTKARPTAQILVEQTLPKLKPAQSIPIKVKQKISQSVEITQNPIESPKKRAEKTLAETVKDKPAKSEQKTNYNIQQITQNPIESPKKRAQKTIAEAIKDKPAKSEKKTNYNNQQISQNPIKSP